MSRLDLLEESYRRHVAIPLQSGRTVAERIWFVVYAPEDERRLRNRLTEFEIATTDAGLAWRDIDLTGSFAEWVDAFYEDEDERLAALADPDLIESNAQTAYRDHLVSRIRAATHEAPDDEAAQTVFAFFGLMELYDFIHVSEVMESLGKDTKGVLLLFFPGAREGNSYRFLGARDGWDYLATPILPE